MIGLVVIAILFMPVDTVNECYITLYGALLLNMHIPIAKFCDDIIERSVNEHMFVECFVLGLAHTYH